MRGLITIEQEGAIPPLEELILIDKLLLMAIVESLGSDNLKTTPSLTDILESPLSPLYTMDETILERLFKANILLLNPMDSLDYTNMTESGEIDINLDYSQATFDFAYDVNNITSLRVEV